MYDGKLVLAELPPKAKKAWHSLRAQRRRCSSPKALDYKYYGAKGIKVEYNTREFINWWLVECEKYTDGERLTVNRINSDGNYCFSNIELIPLSENIAEANMRCKVRPVESYCLSTKKTHKKFKSCKDASLYYGVTIGYVYRRAKNLTLNPTKLKIGFRFI